jgi:hypothetical protein
MSTSESIEKKRIHDSPWMSIADIAVLNRFAAGCGIDFCAQPAVLLRAVLWAFSKMPYENLTKIIKSDNILSPSSALRFPDELINDYLQWGTGGTCFSLTAALVAVLDALGVQAYPVLADRYYGPDTHCGLIIPDNSGGIVLLDPGYLVFEPIPVIPGKPSYINTGYNTVELLPHAGGAKADLFTIANKNRKLRLTFKMEPVSDESFRRAWENSFAFEMMHYPVLTRVVNGEHVYLQGDALSVRGAEKTLRRKFSPEDEVSFITGVMGINREIVLKAMGKIKYGRN